MREHEDRHGPKRTTKAAGEEGNSEQKNGKGQALLIHIVSPVICLVTSIRTA
jgi:hypothetical protein